MSEYLEQSLAIRHSLLTDSHPEVAQSLNRLGMLRNRQGDRQEAIRLYRKALDIFQRELGPDHL